MRLPYNPKPWDWEAIAKSCGKSPDVLRIIILFLDAWNKFLVQESEKSKIQHKLGEMLEHMLNHVLAGFDPSCINGIRNIFKADIESIPVEPELPDVSPEKAEKIASLIRIVDAQYGVSGSKNRLNHLERVFILGHRNKVMKVFSGEMKHNRASSSANRLRTSLFYQ